MNIRELFGEVAGIETNNNQLNPDLDPERGVVRVTSFKILGPLSNFRTGEARHFKFGMQVDHGNVA